MSSVGRKLAVNFQRGKNSLKKKFSTGTSGDSFPGLDQDEIDLNSSGDSPLPSMANTPTQRRTSGHGEWGLQKSVSNISVPSTFHKQMKSNSVGSINSDSIDTPVVNQDDILSLTQDVRNFSDALAKLKSVFLDDATSDEDKFEGARIAAHERLGEVLCILKNVLQKYPRLHSTDVLTAAGLLISKIKSYDYEEESAGPSCFYDSIDQLALAFSRSVSEYLMGDVEASYTPTLSKTRSFEDLSSMNPEFNSHSDTTGRTADALTPAEIDAVLLKLESGVDLALQRAKTWSRYAKDVMTYVEKRNALEAEHAKNLAKLAHTMRPIITEESFLPFQSTYCTAMDQDTDYSVTLQATVAVIQGQKYIEPLNLRRQEHDKARKAIKENWTRELKRMNDAVNNLRKARSLYVQRQQEYEKTKEAAQKVESESLNQSGGFQKIEKKKRAEEDAMHKALEAQTTYQACVVEANQRQMELEKVKGNVLSQIRELMSQCDQTMKSVTVGYFQFQHTVSAPTPVQCQTLCENCRLYEPGGQYAEYVRRLPVPTVLPSSAEPFVFEPYVVGRLSSTRQRKRSSQSTESRESISGDLGDEINQSPVKQKGTPKSSHPMKAWTPNQGVESSETESYSGSSNKSRDSSPSASPRDQPRQHLGNSLGELIEDGDANHHDRRPSGCIPDSSPTIFRGSHLSKMASTHVLRKLRAPARCRECDSYVYFQGAECEKCGLACHRKCLENLNLPCGFNQRFRKRRMTTFGVDFNAHLEETKAEIPKLVAKCVAEIDKRGLDTKGIYRVSGVKSRVEKLCQSFEDETEKVNVDLSEHHPNVIANVLKLYLRQLPEPLLTVKLYQDFVNVAKEDQINAEAGNSDRRAVITKIKNLLTMLPKTNYRTLAVIMHHLKNVTKHEEESQMNSTNLGIVFGPTLLRPSEGTASLSSLMDTPLQTRAIEILVTHVQDIFGSVGESDVRILESHNKQTPVESLSSETPSHDSGAVLKEANSNQNKDSGQTSSEGTMNLMDDIMSVISKTEPQATSHEISLPGSTDRTDKSHSDAISQNTTDQAPVRSKTLPPLSATGDVSPGTGASASKLFPHSTMPPNSAPLFKNFAKNSSVSSQSTITTPLANSTDSGLSSICSKNQNLTDSGEHSTNGAHLLTEEVVTEISDSKQNPKRPVIKPPLLSPTGMYSVQNRTSKSPNLSRTRPQSMPAKSLYSGNTNINNDNSNREVKSVFYTGDSNLVQPSKSIFYSSPIKDANEDSLLEKEEDIVSPFEVPTSASNNNSRIDRTPRFV